jgi:hypothetical protein
MSFALVCFSYAGYGNGRSGWERNSIGTMGSRGNGKGDCVQLRSPHPSAHPSTAPSDYWTLQLLALAPVLDSVPGLAPVVLDRAVRGPGARALVVPLRARRVCWLSMRS